MIWVDIKEGKDGCASIWVVLVGERERLAWLSQLRHPYRLNPESGGSSQPSNLVPRLSVSDYLITTAAGSVEGFVSSSVRPRTGHIRSYDLKLHAVDPNTRNGIGLDSNVANTPAVRGRVRPTNRYTSS